MELCESLKEKIREPLAKTGITRRLDCDDKWNFEHWARLLERWYHCPAWTLFTDALKDVTVTEAECEFYRRGLRVAGHLSQEIIDAIPLKVEEKPFKPYAVLFTDDGIVRKAIADDGDWVTLAEKQGSYPSPKRNESVVRITNEHKALRILRDVCGEDDLIEKVKEYARLSSGLRQGWSEHYIHYQKLLNFIESEQAKMKEGSNG